MIRFIENKKETPVNNDSLLRQRVKEFTNYRNISLQDAVARLTTEVKGNSIQCHWGHVNGVGFMEGRYTILKNAGGELRFLDSRNVNNRLVIYLRDATEVTIGEDAEVQYVTFRFDLKDKTFISVTPMTSF
jgi:hypothetical protein